VHYLVQLNGQYQGKATGETFNNHGKTDILIRHENENVFVDRMQILGGLRKLEKDASTSSSAIRHGETPRLLFIIFSRRQDFTSIISEAQRAMRTISTTNPGRPRKAKAASDSLHSSQDKQRDIIVTLMLFDMPKPVKP